MSVDRPSIVIQGVETAGEVPGIEAIEAQSEIRCAADLGALRRALPGAEVLFGWKFAAEDIRYAFDCADRLRWIQWGGAGVDAALFPALVESDVTVTNVRGVFDEAMAEYTLGMILTFAKDFRRTFALQGERDVAASPERAGRGHAGRSWWAPAASAAPSRARCAAPASRSRGWAAPRATAIPTSAACTASRT